MLPVKIIAKKIGMKIVEYTPEILTGLGFAATTAGFVYAHKDSYKAHEAMKAAQELETEGYTKVAESLAEDRKKIEEANANLSEDQYSKEDYDKDIKKWEKNSSKCAKRYSRRMKVVGAKAYIKADKRAVGLYSLGSVCYIVSSVLNRKRRIVDLGVISSLTLMLSDATMEVNNMRKMIADGELKEKTIKNDDGSKTTIIEQKSLLQPDYVYGHIGHPYSPYTVRIDDKSFIWQTTGGDEQAMMRMLYLIQAELNDLREQYGRVSLIKALECLSVDINNAKIDKGVASRVGWLGGTWLAEAQRKAQDKGMEYYSDERIDLGCFKYDDDGNPCGLLFGNDDALYISFNCDGDITTPFL